MVYIVSVGFALWIEEELAWAQGTHEYRPMGVAVIAATDLFSLRDFDPRRRGPSPRDPSFAGLFASIGELNGHLRRRRPGASRSRARRAELG